MPLKPAPLTDKERRDVLNKLKSGDLIQVLKSPGVEPAYRLVRACRMVNRPTFKKLVALGMIEECGDGLDLGDPAGTRTQTWKLRDG